MTTAAPLSTDTVAVPASALPPRFAADLTAVLRADEQPRAWLDTDLDEQLRFATGVVVLTDRRLLARGPHDSGWQSWSLQADLRLDHVDHAGVGQLALLDDQGRLACWRYTLGRNAAALGLIAEFECCRDGLVNGETLPRRPTETVCAQCNTPLTQAEGDCPVCEGSVAAAPSSWTLLRLWRFARPYRGQLFIGFVLTLGATAAQLVPPYLTMPLMDRVLIPFQNGQPI
ncbi:MAG: ABC transporter, partial [Pigmentiphaga sp.]